MKSETFPALVSGVAVSLAASPAQAVTFHFMQIQQVIGGVRGDTSAQAIQLRLRFPGDTALEWARIRAWDSAGTNPITLIDFDTGVPNGGLGAQVLITSPNLTNYTEVPVTNDFTLENLIPESYLAAGRLTYEGDDGTVYWSLAFGGEAYTGPTTGSSFNDADGDYGPPYDGPLPSNTGQALLFLGSSTDSSTSNETDYALTVRAVVFRNNAGEHFRVLDSATTLIPTVSEWGMVVMTLLVLTAGTIVLRRDRLAPQGG